jgi:hypothetical protein
MKSGNRSVWTRVRRGVRRFFTRPLAALTAAIDLASNVQP